MADSESNTKERILSQALVLLENNRGKNVRMGDIAKAAGVSRQAIYLHFKSQADLMVATVQYGDELNGADTLVEPWKKAKGVDKLDTWIEFWGNYIPRIFGVAKALMIARETDDAAAAAWNDRMNGVRRSCRKTVQELADNGLLSDEWTVKTAADFLWIMLSISSWEELASRGWSSKQYVERMKVAARKALL